MFFPQEIIVNQKSKFDNISSLVLPFVSLKKSIDTHLNLLCSPELLKGSLLVSPPGALFHSRAQSWTPKKRSGCAFVFTFQVSDLSKEAKKGFKYINYIILSNLDRQGC